MRKALLPAAAAAAALAILVIGYLLNPHLVYDSFIWKYYWGPIVADAAGRPLVSAGGVTAYPGYNWVNTLTWAAVLGAALLGLIRFFRRAEVVLERRIVLHLLPFVLLGAVARALNDAEVFGPPVEYLLITPLIYVVMFLLVLGTILAGEYLERRGSLRRNHLVSIVGGLLLLAALLAVATRLDAPGARPVVPLQAAVVATVLAGAGSLLGRFIALRFLATGLGFAVLFAHMFDAASTYIGYTLGYVEKHVLPTLLIDATGTAAVMFPLKLAVVVPVLWILSDYDDPRDTFTTLLYLTVLVLGLGPGTRNVTRMAMGV